MESDPIRVFMIDDSDTDISLTEQGLADHGIDVSSTSTAFGAHIKLNEMRPDLVLLDVTMPALDGPEVCRFLKKHATEPVRIVLHSHLEPSQLEKFASECGADAFVQKTPDFNGLAAKIRQIIQA